MNCKLESSRKLRLKRKSLYLSGLDRWENVKVLHFYCNCNGFQYLVSTYLLMKRVMDCSLIHSLFARWLNGESFN